MDSITRMVDIPYVFGRLSQLPSDLAMTRSEVWEKTQALSEATQRHEVAQAVALEAAAEAYAECKNPEQRSQFKTLLFQRDAGVVAAACNLNTAQEELNLSKDTLANLKDEETALRYTIRLISALTLGDDTMPANVLYDKLLDALLDKREGTVLVAEATTTTTLPEFSNTEKYAEFADDPDDGLPF